MKMANMDAVLDFMFTNPRHSDGVRIDEPHHEKTCFCPMRTTKAQISLRIHAVWSAPLFFTAWIV